jgi:hypothetical protein
MQEGELFMNFLLFLSVLKPYHETVGNFRSFEIKNNKLKLIFNINKEIELPEHALDKEELTSLKGSRIGVFNVGDGRYVVRKIWKKNKEYNIFKGADGTTLVSNNKGGKSKNDK